MTNCVIKALFYRALFNAFMKALLKILFYSGIIRLTQLCCKYVTTTLVYKWNIYECILQYSTITEMCIDEIQQICFRLQLYLSFIKHFLFVFFPLKIWKMCWNSCWLYLHLLYATDLVGRDYTGACVCVCVCVPSLPHLLMKTSCLVPLVFYSWCTAHIHL